MSSSKRTKNKTYPRLRTDLPYETVGGRSIFKNVRKKIADRVEEEAFLATLPDDDARDYLSYHYSR